MQINSLSVNDSIGLKLEMSETMPGTVKTQGEAKESNGQNSYDELSKAQQKVLEKVKGMSKLGKEKTTSIEYSIHKETKTVMIKVIDKEADQVISELPPEKILNFVADMIKRNGLFVDARR